MTASSLVWKAHSITRSQRGHSRRAVREPGGCGRRDLAPATLDVCDAGLSLGWPGLSPDPDGPGPRGRASVWRGRRVEEVVEPGPGRACRARSQGSLLAGLGKSPAVEPWARLGSLGLSWGHGNHEEPTGLSSRPRLPCSPSRAVLTPGRGCPQAEAWLCHSLAEGPWLVTRRGLAPAPRTVPAQRQTAEERRGWLGSFQPGLPPPAHPQLRLLALGPCKADLRREKPQTYVSGLGVEGGSGFWSWGPGGQGPQEGLSGACARVACPRQARGLAQEARCTWRLLWFLRPLQNTAVARTSPGPDPRWTSRAHKWLFLDGLPEIHVHFSLEGRRGLGDEQRTVKPSR